VRCALVTGEALSQDAKRVTLSLKLQQLEIENPIMIGKENILPVIAALRDVVWRTGQHKSRSARHAR